MPGLLPAPSQLARLSDEQTRIVVGAFDQANKREHSYASLSMICGTASFLGVIGTFALLILHGHPEAAGTVVGTGVLTVVGKIIGSRLSKK